MPICIYGVTVHVHYNSQVLKHSLSQGICDFHTSEQKVWGEAVHTCNVLWGFFYLLGLSFSREWTN